MRPVRDWLLLFVAAIAFIVAGLGIAFATSGFAAGDQWYVFTCMTLFLFGYAAWTITKELEHPRYRQYRAAPALTLGALLLLHCAIVGGVIYAVRPAWRMLEWTVLGILEATIIQWTLAVVYGRIAESSRRRTRKERGGPA